MAAYSTFLQACIKGKEQKAIKAYLNSVQEADSNAEKIDINAQDENNNTALHYVVRYGMNDLTGLFDILIELEETKINIDIQNNLGNTLLHEAAR